MHPGHQVESKWIPSGLELPPKCHQNRAHSRVLARFCPCARSWNSSAELQVHPRVQVDAKWAPSDHQVTADITEQQRTNKRKTNFILSKMRITRKWFQVIDYNDPSFATNSGRAEYDHYGVYPITETNTYPHPHTIGYSNEH